VCGVDLGEASAFVTEYCESAPGFSVRRDQLFSYWAEWRKANGKPDLGRSIFGRLLKATVPGLRYRRPEPSRAYFYVGIRIKTAALAAAS